MLGDKSTGMITQGFRMIFYVSYRDRKEAVGIHLLEALQAFCEKNKLKNFELNMRISSENKGGARWDGEWIDQQLASYNSENVKKIWVCGPPVMSETFEMKFREYSQSNPGRFGTGVLEIL